MTSLVTNWITFFFVFSYVLSYRFIDGKRISNSINKKYTEEVEINADAIECIDIHKQPSLSHPLFKDHILQMRPSSYPKGFEARNNTKLKALCPEGTIPITTKQILKPPKVPLFRPNRTQHPFIPDDPKFHEYSQVAITDGPYYGTHAKFGVWKPSVTNNLEFSLAQLWLLAGPDEELNTIEAGWHVTSDVAEPRLFIYWTRDNYKETGCYNLDCEGFVQISTKIALGSFLHPVSTYGGPQYHVEIVVHKDKVSGNWWLIVQGEAVGYWPPTIFTSLAESASDMNWGGEVINFGIGGHHTTTQMGSGHFAGEGFGKSAIILELQYVDESGALKDAQNLIPFATHPLCYDLEPRPVGEWGFGVHFFHGGPGFSNQCP